MSTYQPRRALVEDPADAPNAGQHSPTSRTATALEETAAEAGGVPGVSTEPARRTGTGTGTAAT